MEKTKNEKTINVRQNEEMDLRKIVPWISLFYFALF